MPQILEVVKKVLWAIPEAPVKNVVSLQEPHDSTGDEASVIFTPPSPSAWIYTLVSPISTFLHIPTPHPVVFWVDCSPPTGNADL